MFTYFGHLFSRIRDPLQQERLLSIRGRFRFQLLLPYRIKTYGALFLYRLYNFYKA